MIGNISKNFSRPKQPSQGILVSSYSLFHILEIKTNYYQLENLKRIEKKIAKNLMNPITGFDCKDMK